MVNSPPQQARVNNIDALRLLLALLVVYSHSYSLTMGDYRDEPLARFSTGQITLGEVAVHWFFALSGFLITQSWVRSRSPWSFLRKRVARIYPGYLVAVAVCAVVVVPLARTGFAEAGSSRILVQALLLGGFDATGTFPLNPFPGVTNGSLWTIPYEFCCYLLIAVLGIPGLMRRPIMVGLFAIGLVASVGFAAVGSPASGGSLGLACGAAVVWAWVLPCFLSGSLVYFYREWFVCRLRWAVVAALGLGVACRLPHGVALAMPTLGTYLLFYLAFTTNWSWRSASRYGDLSYGVYLYSYPIQQWIVLRSGAALGPWELFASSLIPSLGAGFLSWHLAERFWLERKSPRFAPEPTLSDASSQPSLSCRADPSGESGTNARPILINSGWRSS